MCKYEGLNLYCSGQWSRTVQFDCASVHLESLNPYCSGQWSRTVQFDCASVHLESLNPYCSGRWSRTARTIVMNTVDEFVLILVVVDNGLVLRIHY